MVLCDRVVHRLVIGVLWSREDRRDVEALRLPVVHRVPNVECLDVADRLFDTAEAELCEILANFLGDVLHEVDDELRFAGKALAQLGVLRGDADGTRVEVTHAHHHATAHHERCSGEAELFGAEQCRDDDVTTGLHLAVSLHDDAVSQAIHQQRLLCLGETNLPRRTRVLERRQRRCTGATVVTRDENDVGLRLAHTCRHGADTNLGDELDVHTSSGIRVLQVVDELLQVLDRIDVVVRRRTDETDARRGVASLGDPWVHLVTRQLAALARLCTLGHLDLEIVGIHEVFARHSEST